MEESEAREMAKWLDDTSREILRDMGFSYRYHTNNIADTDANLVYHGKLVENIFYKMFMSILEATADEDKDAQMGDMIYKLKRYRLKVRNEDEMLEAIQEEKAQ